MRRVNPQLEIIVGVAQPWGDYLAEQERSKTPFIFADDLLRMGLKPTALDLELIMGISPRGSYCRDLLDTLAHPRTLYALLGVPIQATLGYPSSAVASGVGRPRSARQSRLLARRLFRGNANRLGRLLHRAAMCKPYVRSVQWAHWSDALTARVSELRRGGRDGPSEGGVAGVDEIAGRASQIIGKAQGDSADRMRIFGAWGSYGFSA